MIRLVFTCQRCLAEITLEGKDSKALVKVLHEAHKNETNCNWMFGQVDVWLGERHVSNFHVNVYH